MKKKQLMVEWFEIFLINIINIQKHGHICIKKKCRPRKTFFKLYFFWHNTETCIWGEKGGGNTCIYTIIYNIL